jgi:hypothetical protein
VRATSNRRRPIARRLGEHREHQLVELPGQADAMPRRRRRQALEVRGGEIVVRAGEGGATGEELVEQAAERVDVGAMIDDAAPC